MSCGCGCNGCDQCHQNPCVCGGQRVPACNPPMPQVDSAAQQLKQLNAALFGPSQIVIVNGRPVWQSPCGLTSQIGVFLRNAGEGMLCYILRYLTANFLNLNGTNISAGTGSPNGLYVGNPGDLYMNKNGGPGTTLYVKESGVNTSSGWVPK